MNRRSGRKKRTIRLVCSLLCALESDFDVMLELYHLFVKLGADWVVFTSWGVDAVLRGEGERGEGNGAEGRVRRVPSSRLRR